MIKYVTTTAPDDPKRKMALALLREQQNATGSDKAASRYGRLAEAFATAGSSTEPVGHWMQAVARGVQGAVGGLYGDLARKEDVAADQRASAAGLAKEGRDHDRALDLARAKAALEQQDPAYQANLAKTKAETGELSAKGRYRDSIMRMLVGDNDTPQTEPANVGGPLPDPNAPAAASPPRAPPAPMPEVQPQSFNGASMQPTPAVDTLPAGNVPPPAPGTASAVDPAARQRMAQTLASGDVQAQPAPASPAARRMAQIIAGGEMTLPSQQPMPGVQLVADQGAPAGPAPMQTPPSAAQPRADLIDTPYGRMTRDEARRRSGIMMLDPQFATAGKALSELVQSNSDPGLAKPTINDLETRTVNSAAHLSRLDDIDKKFDPKWLEIPKRFEMLGASWSAKAGEMLGGKLSPDKTQELRTYAQFRSSSVNNLNTILKEMSGAAVTPQEYERIQNDQPVAGTGLFDGDDPVSFKAKLDRSKSTLKAAIARFNFMRSKGLNFDRDSLDQFMALEDVPAAIDQRGGEIEREILNKTPNIDKSMLQDRVGKQLKREFGI